MANQRVLDEIRQLSPEHDHQRIVFLSTCYDSERGKRALQRMNQVHSRFKIPNDDFRYVLSTFIYEPIRWNAQFGWRPLCQQERLGYFHFWREVGPAPAPASGLRLISQIA